MATTREFTLPSGSTLDALEVLGEGSGDGDGPPGFNLNDDILSPDDLALFLRYALGERIRREHESSLYAG